MLSPAIGVGVAVASEEVVGAEQAEVAAGTTQEQALESLEVFAEHCDTNVGRVGGAVDGWVDSV